MRRESIVLKGCWADIGKLHRLTPSLDAFGRSLVILYLYGLKPESQNSIHEESKFERLLLSDNSSKAFIEGRTRPITLDAKVYIKIAKNLNEGRYTGRISVGSTSFSANGNFKSGESGLMTRYPKSRLLLTGW